MKDIFYNDHVACLCTFLCLLTLFLIKLNLLVFLSESSTSISTETLFFISDSECRFYLCLVLPKKWLLGDWLGISLLVGGAECLHLHHLDFFPQVFLHVYKCLYLDPWVFLTFPLSILSCIPLWGWADGCLIAGQGQHVTCKKSLTFFSKNSSDMTLLGILQLPPYGGSCVIPRHNLN